MKVTVTGCRFFEGNINGNEIQSGKIYTECKLDSSKNNARGYFTEEWRVTPGLVKSIIHLPFPFTAILETERIGNGREAREVVIDLKPITDAGEILGTGAPPSSPAATKDATAATKKAA